MSLEDTYRERFSGSAERHVRAAQIFPNGVTHDGRYLFPFPLYIQRALGPYKWDVDDNRMIDYWSGHGALLLGHSHPSLVGAVQSQVAIGTHYGACHDLELRWGALVQQLIPSAELVRFTASGTEATLMALRLARAYTGRPAIARLIGHFHGWHDLIVPGTDPDDPSVGIPTAVRDQLVVLPADLDQIEQTLRQRTDIGALILEPTGASYGTVPLSDDTLRDLRLITTANNVLLIYDEVVTGFRVSPGGAQQRAGVIPDLTCLAKVLAGGLPGGAVVGRADVLQHLAFGTAEWNQASKIRHQGTFNANPLSAAAGSAMLELVRDTDVCEQTATQCQQLILALNELFSAYNLRGWTAYGDSSIFHIFAGGNPEVTPGSPPLAASFAEIKRHGDPTTISALRQALLCEGVDLMRGASGFISIAHDDDVIRETIAAFARALDVLKGENNGIT